MLWAFPLRRRGSDRRPSIARTPTQGPVLLPPVALQPESEAELAGFGKVVSAATPLVNRRTWKPLSWLVVQRCRSLPCQMNREFAVDQSAV